MTSQRVTMVLAAALFGAATGHAGEVKDILQHERNVLSGQCQAIEFYPGFIEIMDLNGDGTEDAIVDYQYLSCDGSSLAFCGSGGCTLKLYGGKRGGLFDEAGEFLSYGLKIVGKGKAARIAISVHGSECGKDGAAPCTLTGRLRNGTFIVERKR